MPRRPGVRSPAADTVAKCQVKALASGHHFDLGCRRRCWRESAHGRVGLRIVDDIQSLGEAGHEALQPAEELAHALRCVPIEAEQLLVGARIGV